MMGNPCFGDSTDYGMCLVKPCPGTVNSVFVSIGLTKLTKGLSSVLVVF